MADTDTPDIAELEHWKAQYEAACARFQTELENPLSPECRTARMTRDFAENQYKELLVASAPAILARLKAAEGELAEWKRESLSPLLHEWGGGTNPPMQKHVANHPDTCRRIVAKLEAAGLAEEASWAKWILWWMVLGRNRENRFCKEVLEVEKLRLEVEEQLESAEASLKLEREKLATARKLIARSHVFAVAYANDILAAANDDIDAGADEDYEDARDWALEKQEATEATALAGEMTEWLKENLAILDRKPAGGTPNA